MRSSICRRLKPMAKAVVASSFSLSLSRRMRGPAAGYGAATAPGLDRSSVGGSAAGSSPSRCSSFCSVLVDGLAAAPGLLGLAGDGAVLTGEDGGGVEDPGANG